MKCLSKLLFNVYEDERQQVQQQQQQQEQHKCLRDREEFAGRGEASKTQRSSKAPASKAFQRISADGTFDGEETRHGLTCSPTPSPTTPPTATTTSTSSSALVSLEQATTSSGISVGSSRLIGGENLTEDDWVLLDDEESSQLTDRPFSSESLSPSDEHELREITVNNRDHHHCHLHSDSHLREPLKQPPQQLPRQLHCRLANAIVADDASSDQVRPQTTTFTTPVNTREPIDFGRTDSSRGERQQQQDCNIDLRTIESSGCKRLIYRARFNKRRPIDSDCPTEVNLPATTTTKTTNTTVTMDSTDIELIRASWKPARKDPVAAGALLFKG